MDKPIYLGFALLESSKLHMHETYYDKLPAHFGQEILQLHYIDTDGMIEYENKKKFMKDLKSLEDISYFSNLDKDHVLFSNKKEK